MEVLNKPLYDAVRKMAGSSEVRVVSPGRAGAYSEGLRPASVGKKTGGHTTSVVSWGECYRTDCPCCGDTRGRLFFSHLCGAWFKKSSGTIRFSDKLYKCHNEDCQRGGRLEREFNLKVPSVNLKEACGKADIPCEASPLSSNAVPADMPTPLVDLLRNKLPASAVGYMEGRGWDLDVLRGSYGCLYAPAGAEWTETAAAGEKYKRSFRVPRLLIPVARGRRVVSWQARSLVEGATRKYMSPSGFPKSSVLYNMDEAKFHDTVVVHEGCTDCWRTGSSAVALFGKSLSEGQLAIMELFWRAWGRCAVALDPGGAERKAARLIAKRLRESDAFPGGVAVIDLEGGRDPGDMDEGEMMSLADGADYAAAPETTTLDSLCLL